MSSNLAPKLPIINKTTVPTALITPGPLNVVAAPLNQTTVGFLESPDLLPDHFCKFLSFLDIQTDAYRVELSGLLYPIFVQIYIKLIGAGRTKEAKNFLEEYRIFQEAFYQEDISILASIDSIEQLRTNPMISNFKVCNFVVSIPKECHDALNRFIAESKMHGLQIIIRDQLTVEVFEGPPRSQAQIECRRGALFGEVAKDVNKEAIFYSSFNRKDTTKELDYMELYEDDSEDSALKKKRRREMFTASKAGTHGKKTDLNSPPLDRIPLPNLSQAYLDARETINREISMSFKSNLSSIRSRGISSVLYTVCNAQTGESAISIRKGGVNCMSFDTTASVMGAGFGTGRVRVWSLGAESLRQLMDPDRLGQLDKNDPWVKTKMLHDENDILVEGERRAETGGFSSPPTETRILGLVRREIPPLWVRTTPF
ncbi:Transcription initiation factor TFIID subunit 5 [Cichlidogyrus casuarinus]|uniref:Transcription initiation factor TFIID subunit 5 n=1 Tax=Cichlidogyrus casuarinus TaxID=1844966 RepID=A0ABD2PUP2_9PLAT